MVAKPLFRKQLFRNCKVEVNTAFCTLSYNLNSEPFLYLFGVKNAILCKFLDKLPAFRQASELSFHSLIGNFVPRVLFHEPASARFVWKLNFHTLAYSRFWYSRNYTYFSPTAQFRRHLGNTQTSLVFHSVYTKFAILKWRYKAKSSLKITNLHILGRLAWGEYWRHLGIASELPLLSVCIIFVQMSGCTF